METKGMCNVADVADLGIAMTLLEDMTIGTYPPTGQADAGENSTSLEECQKQVMKIRRGLESLANCGCDNSQLRESIDFLNTFERAATKEYGLNGKFNDYLELEKMVFGAMSSCYCFCGKQ